MPYRYYSVLISTNIIYTFRISTASLTYTGDICVTFAMYMYASTGSISVYSLYFNGPDPMFEQIFSTSRQHSRDWTAENITTRMSNGGKASRFRISKFRIKSTKYQDLKFQL